VIPVLAEKNFAFETNIWRQKANETKRTPVSRASGKRALQLIGMEVADFVADSEEEEEEELERSEHVHGALLVADEGEQFGGSNALVVVASTRSLASGAANPLRQATEHATEPPVAAESMGEEHRGTTDPEETELPVHRVSAIIGATNGSHMGVEAASSGADVEDVHGSSNDDSGSEEGDHEGGGDDDDASDEIVVGSVVQVEARTWPGINKQGGAGRVTAVHRETEDDGETSLVLYDVRYIFGGVDKRVESRFVQLLWKVHLEAKRKKVEREFYHGTRSTTVCWHYLDSHLCCRAWR
jgi:hypothetical protein